MTQPIKLTVAEQAEYDRIKRNLAEAKAFCDKHGIDQLEALGLRSRKHSEMIEIRTPDGEVILRDKADNHTTKCGDIDIGVSEGMESSGYESHSKSPKK